MKFFKKPVAPDGYKNKQRRKQTSVLSGRIVTAYVPLRSATERERAAFLIPCQGLRGFDSISLLTLNLVLKAMDGGRDASAAVDKSITGEGVHRHDGRVA